MQSSPSKPMRLAKRIAEAGICSRRKAEELITSGSVTVNGIVVNTPAFTVTYADSVTVNSQPLPQEPSRLRMWLFNKPAGCITTTSDPQKRQTVFGLLPPDMPRVITIGRLDYNSEGLLLLTNNGDIARYCELPKTGWQRSYRVRAHGIMTAKSIAQAAKGLTIEGVRYEPIRIEQEPIPADRKATGHGNHWFKVTLTEGKNREIRKVFEHFGLAVNRLIRVSYGPFQLGELSRGATREIPASILKKYLGHVTLS